MVASNVAYSSMRKAHLLVLDRRNTLKTTKTYCSKKKTTKARQTRLTTKKPKLTRKKITGGRPGKRVAMQLVKMSRALSNLNLSALTG